MDEIFIKTVNSMFYPICFSDKIIRFDDDMKQTEHNQEDAIKDIEINNYVLRNEEIKNLNVPNKEIKILSPKMIETYFDKISEIENEDQLWEILDEIVDHHLMSSKTEYCREQNTNMNILIMGGGPNGLFLAYYLDTIYNDIYQRSDLKPNIFLIDNRIERENIRKPFSRTRTFNICTPYLSTLFPDIFHKINNGYNCLSIQIKYFELLSYIYCYMRGIPMMFTKKYEDEKELLKLINNNKIDIIFDSTGGRLQLNNLKINQDFANKCLSMSNKLTLNNNKLEYMPEQFNYWCGVDLLDENFNTIRFKIVLSHVNDYLYQHEIKNMDDFNTLQNILIKKEDLLVLVTHIHDEILQKEILFNYNYCMNNPKVKYVKMYTFTADMYHRTICSQKITDKCVYVGVGDTIFHSHFLTTAGLNRTVLLSVKIAHLLPMLMHR